MQPLHITLNNVLIVENSVVLYPTALRRLLSREGSDRITRLFQDLVVKYSDNFPSSFYQVLLLRSSVNHDCI
jgi:hypothetical protein